MTLETWFWNVARSLSRTANALFLGDPDHTLSWRIGWSILEGGVWFYIPMPKRIRGHFLRTARHGD